ncbi:AI-2E family transporter [Paenibacillus sp. GCM10012307]|uniref:AI-2E family transporter n=1 Tax=Paenibacillus roseus TaxID=2798579 RepID=A0A934J0Q3_9BACL|nr:AI-2E family transporter [Paenibacillus roseus]MBJ6360600.1 AI-2E family transporter [Paenibacillus roseus]
MQEFIGWLKQKDVRRFLILALICLLIFSVRSMMNLILLTLLFTFLMGSLHVFVMRHLDRFYSVPSKVILPLLYILLLLLIIFGFYKFVPSIGNQIVQLYKIFKWFYFNPPDTEFTKYIMGYLNSVDFQKLIAPSFNLVVKISQVALNVFLALILSLFFLLEKTKVTQFSAQFKKSKLGWLFEEVGYFGNKFIQTFGKVIETQILISLINSILTTIGLWVMGFPHLLGLALIVFLLGLIPVAGVFISLVPLGTIAYSIGGFNYLLYLLILIVVLHTIEAYVLNPKLMSSKTHLPIFYTFIVLLFSEHFFGIWGLIIGIPIFVFMLDVIEVKPVESSGRH